MLPYILKICGFKNSIVYTFYSMYQKYTLFVKLYIYGLTYRLYLRYKHKLRIDVITYIPTLANGPPSAAVCLRYYRYYRTAGPSSTGYPNIRTSAGYPFCWSPENISSQNPRGPTQESADDPGLSRWPSGGDDKIFKNVVLAHY